MKILVNNFIGILMVVCIFALTTCQSGNQKKESTDKSGPEVMRIGMVIMMKPDRINDYLEVHSDSYSGVRDLLQKYNMHDFSIFMTRLDDGNYYEFGYYEYTGSNYEADMAALAAEPRNIEWLKKTDAMQIPLNGETSWKKMKQVFYNK